MATIREYHDLVLKSHKVVTPGLISEGYRCISLSMYKPSAEILVAAVWSKSQRLSLGRTTGIIYSSKTTVLGDLIAQQAEGFYPTIVAVAGTPPLFAVVLENDPALQDAFLAIDESNLQLTGGVINVYGTASPYTGNVGKFKATFFINWLVSYGSTSAGDEVVGPPPAGTFVNAGLK